MKLNRVHIVVVVSTFSLSLALVLLIRANPPQDIAEPRKQEDRATTFQSSGSAPPFAGVSPDALPPCGVVNPFGKLDTPCNPNVSIAQAGGPAGAQESTGATSVMGPVPDFVEVEVVGSLGSGVAASLLKAAGRSLAGTRASHDSMLIDTSNASDVEVAAAVRDALNRGQYIIVDGGDSMESSTRLNQIMNDLNLLHMRGVTAYGLSKGTDGKLNVTPLQTVADEKGARQINQIHNVLNINKT